jgi:hypothetical protein
MTILILLDDFLFLAESALRRAQTRLDNFDAFIGGFVPSFATVFA